MLHHEKNNMQFSKILGEGNGRFSVWQISFLSGTQCFPIKDNPKYSLQRIEIGIFLHNMLVSQNLSSIFLKCKGKMHVI